MTARSTVRRLDPVLLAAVLLPALALVSALLLRPDPPEEIATPPESAPLARLSVACPTPAQRPAGDLRVTRSVDGASGSVAVRVNRDDRLESREEVPATTDLTAVPDSAAAAVVTGTGAGAPGIVAGRDEAGAVPECRPPWYDEWFVGAGASARQSTVIELVNPDPSRAVVTIDVHGPSGLLEDASWRGVTVPGHGVTWVRLGERPVRAAVAAHVQVDQGRVRAFARHQFDRLGQGGTSTDFLQGQAEASRSNLLLGVPARGTQRFLYLANPGEDEVRASVRVVTDASTLQVDDAEPITVPPRGHVRVPLAPLLDGDAAAGALGLLVESSAPVVAGARAVVEDDLAAIGPVTVHAEPVTAVVPPGEKSVIVGGARKAGTVRVRATDEGGREIWTGRRFDITADRALRIELPDEAVRIRVEGRNTPLAGIVVAEDERGRGAIRLDPAPTRAQVPDVRPSG